MDSYLSKTLNNVDRAMPFSNVLLQSADECLEQNINLSLVWHQCKFKKVIVAETQAEFFKLSNTPLGLYFGNLILAYNKVVQFMVCHITDTYQAQ